MERIFVLIDEIATRTFDWRSALPPAIAQNRAIEADTGQAAGDRRGFASQAEGSSARISISPPRPVTSHLARLCLPPVLCTCPPPKPEARNGQTDQ